MSSRQEQIAALIRNALPNNDNRLGFVKSPLHIVAVMCLFLGIAIGGFQYGETIRPLNFSEASILQSMIDYTAAKQNKDAADVKALLLATLRAERLSAIKAYQWKEALNFLSQYME
jgi:hypothetical protein